MKKGLGCLLFLVLICSVAQAETIYFRNGKIMKGEVIRQTNVYIRLKPRYGRVHREFLLENIERIVKDGQVTYKREVLEGFEAIQGSSLDDLPEDVRRAAIEMAVSLIQEAMREVDIPTPAVKDAAAKIAAALIEESVKNIVAMPSLDQVSVQVQEAARKKATALIDEALRSEEINSLTNAPEVKLAAKRKASALIEAAMDEAEVPVIPARVIDPTEVEILMQEAIRQRVDESRTPQETVSAPAQSFEEIFMDGQEIIQEDAFEEEEFEEEFVPQIEVLGQKIDPLRRSPEAEDSLDADVMVSQEVQKSIAEELKKTQELQREAQISPKKILMGLEIKDFFIVGLIIILLCVLLTQRRQGSRRASINHQNVVISSSLTYQNLPDELKGRITSSDVTIILKLQAEFQNQVGLTQASKENKMVIMDDSQMMEYIFESAKKDGHSYRREDVVKVLEIQEKVLEEEASVST